MSSTFCECLRAATIGLLIVALLAGGDIDAKKPVAVSLSSHRAEALAVSEFGGPQNHAHPSECELPKCVEPNQNGCTATAVSHHGHGATEQVSDRCTVGGVDAYALGCGG